MALLALLALLLLASTAAAALADVQAPAAALQQGAPAPDKGSQDKQLRVKIAADVAAVQADEWGWWAENGPDTQYGGFHGTLDRQGNPISPTDKGAVQQARHAWTFSAFFRAGIGLEADKPGGVPRSRQLAQTAYEFLVQHMRDPSDKLFYWSVSRDGKTPVGSSKAIYAQAFAIYALSYFHGTFGTPQAKQLALECFWATDTRWHNASTGGYNELFSAGNSFPFLSDAASRPDYLMPRSINIMMHLIEALLALHKVTQDSLVLKRLLELMDIFCNKLQLTRGNLMSEYTPGGTGAAEWLPAPNSIVSYGHNLEAAWMLADAADYLEYVRAISRPTRVAYYRRLMSVASVALRDGYDSSLGGVFETGTPDGGPTSRVKVWWVQFEAMLAMWKLYKYYNNNLAFLRYLGETSWFTRLHLMDQKYGGLFWQVADNGAFNIRYDPGPNVKGNVWKASYHSSRAVLTLGRWLKQDT